MGQDWMLLVFIVGYAIFIFGMSWLCNHMNWCKDILE